MIHLMSNIRFRGLKNIYVFEKLRRILRKLRRIRSENLKCFSLKLRVNDHDSQKSRVNGRDWVWHASGHDLQLSHVNVRGRPTLRESVRWNRD